MGLVCVQDTRRLSHDKTRHDVDDFYSSYNHERHRLTSTKRGIGCTATYRSLGLETHSLVGKWIILAGSSSWPRGAGPAIVNGNLEWRRVGKTGPRKVQSWTGVLGVWCATSPHVHMTTMPIFTGRETSLSSRRYGMILSLDTYKYLCCAYRLDDISGAKCSCTAPSSSSSPITCPSYSPQLYTPLDIQVRWHPSPHRLLHPITYIKSLHCQWHPNSDPNPHITRQRHQSLRRQPVPGTWS